jgi:hypothetical protein
MKRLGITPTRHPADWRFYVLTDEQLEQIRAARAEMPVASARPRYTRQPAHPTPADVRMDTPLSSQRPLSATYKDPLVYSASPVVLSDGSIRLVDMSRLHGVPDGTLKSQAQRAPELATAVPTGSRDGRQERWCTPEQQSAIITYWRGLGTRYRQCGRETCTCGGE